jgi:uncharacterized membrane protein YphA (DoxX/SURF4 family)
MKFNLKILGVVLISILFLYAGINKILNFNDISKSVNSKLPFLSLNISKFLLGIATIILLIAPIVMIYGVIKENNNIKNIGAALLLLFLSAATIIYHPPTQKDQIMSFLKNMSIAGGVVTVLSLAN